MATVRFPDAEAMESVRSIACGDVARGSGRSSWVKLKTRLSDGGIVVILQPHARGAAARYELLWLTLALPACADGP
jgi:hypothetical protein|eukprot:COSAG02_NODE_2937_length_7700_cov_9.549007_8_plen_76_part_00